jgi:hypothetical protein
MRPVGKAADNWKETDMSDSRHDGSDPRLIEPRDELRRHLRNNDKAVLEPWIGNSMWACFASVAAVIFIIAIVYGFANQATRVEFDRNAPGPFAKSLTIGSTGSGSTSFGSAETTGAKSPSRRSGSFPPF